MAFEVLEGFPALLDCCEGLELLLRELDTRTRLRSECCWVCQFVVAMDERGLGIKGAPATDKNDWTWTKAASARYTYMLRA